VCNLTRQVSVASPASLGVGSVWCRGGFTPPFGNPADAVSPLLTQYPSLNPLAGCVTMFSHAGRPTIVLLLRHAFILGLASALVYSLAIRPAEAAPQTVARDPQALIAHL